MEKHQDNTPAGWLLAEFDLRWQQQHDSIHRNCNCQNCLEHGWGGPDTIRPIIELIPDHPAWCNCSIQPVRRRPHARTEWWDLTILRTHQTPGERLTGKPFTGQPLTRGLPPV